MSNRPNQQRAEKLQKSIETFTNLRLKADAHNHACNLIETALDTVEQAATLNAAQKAWDEAQETLCAYWEALTTHLAPGGRRIVKRPPIFPTNPYRNSGGVEASSEDTRKDQPNVPEPDLQAVTTPAAVSSERPASVWEAVKYVLPIGSDGKQNINGTVKKVDAVTWHYKVLAFGGGYPERIITWESTKDRDEALRHGMRAWVKACGQREEESADLTAKQWFLNVDCENRRLYHSKPASSIFANEPPAGLYKLVKNPLNVIPLYNKP
jgi:hypothetical protein